MSRPYKTNYKIFINSSRLKYSTYTWLVFVVNYYNNDSLETRQWWHPSICCIPFRQIANNFSLCSNSNYRYNWSLSWKWRGKTIWQVTNVNIRGDRWQEKLQEKGCPLQHGQHEKMLKYRWRQQAIVSGATTTCPQCRCTHSLLHRLTLQNEL